MAGTEQSARCIFFLSNDTATTEIYTLSLHDALPVWSMRGLPVRAPQACRMGAAIANPTKSSAKNMWTSIVKPVKPLDRKSTRLNSSHANISYAVFCLKNKKRRQHLARQSHDVW